jgi:hypothetical protein
VSRLVLVRGLGAEAFVGIKRDGGEIALASNYATRDTGNRLWVDGLTLHFVLADEFAAELSAAGLQADWDAEARGF